MALWAIYNSHSLTTLFLSHNPLMLVNQLMIKTNSMLVRLLFPTHDTHILSIQWRIKTLQCWKTLYIRAVNNYIIIEMEIKRDSCLWSYTFIYWIYAKCNSSLALAKPKCYNMECYIWWKSWYRYLAFILKTWKALRLGAGWCNVYLYPFYILYVLNR